MGKIAPNKPVKLIVGFIFKEKIFFERAKHTLTRHFGRIDFESGIIPFTATSYYEEELGLGLSRVFISFAKLIKPQQIAKIKVLTNRIEEKLSNGKKRSVNIDPGYLNLAKLVLASTKDYVHRIYLDKGIYAETTLFYQGKSFQDWKWTYPDFRNKEQIGIFNRIRELYAEQTKDK
ncbi:MAG: DUF4416 family protein [Candidatus Omnitrophota bacterium]|jgi:hypothetical protein